MEEDPDIKVKIEKGLLARKSERTPKQSYALRLQNEENAKNVVDMTREWEKQKGKLTVNLSKAEKEVNRLSKLRVKNLKATKTHTREKAEYKRKYEEIRDQFDAHMETCRARHRPRSPPATVEMKIKVRLGTPELELRLRSRYLTTKISDRNRLFRLNGPEAAAATPQNSCHRAPRRHATPYSDPPAHYRRHSEESSQPLYSPVRQPKRPHSRYCRCNECRHPQHEYYQ